MEARVERKIKGGGRENGSRKSKGRERESETLLFLNRLKLILILRQLSNQDMLITTIPNATFPLQLGISLQ